MSKLTRQDVEKLIEETRVILTDFEGMGLNLKGCDLMVKPIKHHAS